MYESSMATYLNSMTAAAALAANVLPQPGQTSSHPAAFMSPHHLAAANGAMNVGMLATPGLVNYQSSSCFYLNKFYADKVQLRQLTISKTIREVMKVAQDILKEVESQEPRFISTLRCENGVYEGLRVISPTEYEVVLYLNQMGVFNFVDDGTIPGCAVLKLSDGRKRSMSLWVEFITASGYLSARKIRSRFQSLVMQALEKCSYRDIVKLLPDNSEVCLKVRDLFLLKIVPAFRCNGIWPRSASHWPSAAFAQNPNTANGGAPPLWPSPALINEVKMEGFNLLSKESLYMRDKQSSAEGDAWVIDFTDSEERLLYGSCRKKCLSILKTLFERSLLLNPQILLGSSGSNGSNTSGDSSGALMESSLAQQCQQLLCNYHLKTLLLFECSKHPQEYEWSDLCLADRINGILLQFISCLQNRRCPHVFLPQLDLFRGHSPEAQDRVAKLVWSIMRDLVISPKKLDLM